MPPKKVLLLVSDLGIHWDELADAYHVFDDVHWQVDVASPQGHPKVDALTLRTTFPLHAFGRGTTESRLPRTPFFGRPVVDRLVAAKSLADIRGEDYDAFFVVGGYGDLQDLDRDERVGFLLREAHRTGRWLAGRLDLVRGQHAVSPDLLAQTSFFNPIIHGDRVVHSNSSRKARKVARALVARMTNQPGPTGVAEFLDRKAG